MRGKDRIVWVAALLFAFVTGIFVDRIVGRSECSRGVATEDNTLRSRHEKLMRRYRYLKKRDDFLSEKFFGCKEAFGNFLQAVENETSLQNNSSPSELAERAAPVAGVPLIVLDRWRTIRSRCREEKLFRTALTRIDGYDGKKRFIDNEFCDMQDGELLVYLFDASEKGVRRYRSIDANATDARAFWWKERIQKGMESVEKEAPIVREKLIDMYEALLEGAPLSSTLKSEINETLIYWRGVYATP